MSITRSIVSGSTSAKLPRPGMPALLTSRPIRGWRPVTAAAARSTPARSETSQTSNSPPIACARGASFSARRASRMQCQPREASSRAVASPIPDEAPVITATRFPLTGGSLDD